MQRLINYINPLIRLGNSKYSVNFPIILSLVTIAASEFVANSILKNPAAVGAYIIFVHVALIIYFAFRDGIRGGFITTFLAILYYLYIIESRGYKDSQWSVAVNTSFILMFIYLLLAYIIGWLKQRLDQLIVTETEARQAAEDGRARMETILQQLPVGVLMIDKKSNKVETNRHIKNLVGPIRSTLEKVQDYQFPVAFQSGQKLSLRQWPLVRALNSGEVITGEEIEYKNDSRRLFLRVNAAPIKNKNQQIIAAVSTIDDISQEKELEQRKDDFINMASHELKTPITSMKIYIDVLLKNISKHQDPKVTKILNSLRTQTDRLQEIVSDLLDVSRIQTGKLHLNKEQFRLDRLISETSEVLQGTTDKHNLIIKSKKAISVKADRFRIYQVLTNLIANAIKYSPDGKKIQIECKASGTKALVSIKDDGIGISKDQKKRIFERLYQVNKMTEMTFPGLGMGLYISKEIIKRHRGNIWVESIEGKGSTFFFSLPLG